MGGVGIAGKAVEIDILSQPKGSGEMPGLRDDDGFLAALQQVSEIPDRLDGVVPFAVQADLRAIKTSIDGVASHGGDFVIAVRNGRSRKQQLGRWPCAKC